MLRRNGAMPYVSYVSHMCQMCAHCDCVEVRNDDIINLWSCLSRRSLPENVQKISEQMSELEKSLNELKKINVNLVNLVTEQQKEISDLGSRPKR